MNNPVASEIMTAVQFDTFHTYTPISFIVETNGICCHYIPLRAAIR
jgi:hypothetical protein